MKPNRFRFRAWDIQEKRMCRVAAIHEAEGDGFIGATLVFESSGCSEYRDCLNRNIIRLQSTGLADKNGSEIFEGDVVRGIRIAGSAHIRMMFVVEWNGVALVFRDVKEWSNCLSAPKYDVTEVIGNIFENPELVNGG